MAITTKRLTAAEALAKSLLTREERELEYNEGYLNELYSKIESVASSGKTAIYIELSLRANKDYLKKDLEGKGYKVKFTFREDWRDSSEFIDISWDLPKP